GSRFLSCLGGGFRFNDVTVGIDDRLGGCGVDLVAVGIDHEAARVRVVVAGQHDVNIEVVDDRAEAITNVVGGTRCRVVGHTVQRAVEREHGPVSVIAVFGDRGLKELTVIVPVAVFGTDVQVQYTVMFEPVGSLGWIIVCQVGLVVVLVV